VDPVAATFPAAYCFSIADATSAATSSCSRPAPAAFDIHATSSTYSGESVPVSGRPSVRRTKVPWPGRGSTRPSRSSSRYALRVVFGLTVLVAATSLAVGSRSPGTSTPSRRACLVCCTICWKAGTPLRLSMRYSTITTIIPLLD
jgi:hypothetical protein